MEPDIQVPMRAYILYVRVYSAGKLGELWKRTFIYILIEMI